MAFLGKYKNAIIEVTFRYNEMKEDWHTQCFRIARLISPSVTVPTNLLSLSITNPMPINLFFSRTSTAFSIVSVKYNVDFSQPFITLTFLILIFIKKSRPPEHLQQQ